MSNRFLIALGAGLAAGAAGVMFETHDDPGRALSDGPQALDPQDFDTVMRALGAPRRG